jgi:hypothetical protein
MNPAQVQGLMKCWEEAIRRTPNGRVSGQIIREDPYNFYFIRLFVMDKTLPTGKGREWIFVIGPRGGRHWTAWCTWEY